MSIGSVSDASSNAALNETTKLVTCNNNKTLWTNRYKTPKHEKHLLELELDKHSRKIDRVIN
jgi:hypothetical protein